MASERFYPKRERTADVIAALKRKPVRRCMSMHECCLCDEPIRLGESYYDGGLKWRAHFVCQRAEVLHAK